MDYDDNDSQGHSLAGEGNSKSSPVLRPFALPKYDFDDSLQRHLRFESLVENEVFLGISSQEDTQWIEDFSRGNSGIEFSSTATEPCSISRHNNVWSEATSSESVAMLLKSVGQEERPQGETLIQQSDTGNELGKLTTEMEPNLMQDDKPEDITNSQLTANPDSFLDGRTVKALGSEKDNLPVDGSSGIVSIVSSVIMSEADVGSDDKCNDTKHLEVNIIEQPGLDNLEGLSPEMHVQSGISMLPSDMASVEPSKLQENVTCNIQIEEECKIDQGYVLPSQLGNVEFGPCNEGKKICEPLQDHLCDSSSVACLDAHTFEGVNKGTMYPACTGVDFSVVEVKENSLGNQANSLESQNVEAVDIKMGNSSCPEHDMDSIVENENSENCMEGVIVAEASSVPDVDYKLTEQSEVSGIEHVENSDISLSCTVSGSHCEKQLPLKDLSDIKASIVLEDNNSPEAQTPPTEDAKSPTESLCPDESNKRNLIHGSEFPKSANDNRGSEVTEGMNLQSCDMLADPPLLSGSKTTAGGVALGEQEQKSQVAKLLGTENSPQVSTATALEPFGFSIFPKSASDGRGSEVTEGMNLQSCGMLADPPLLSGSKTTAGGVALGEQEQKSQVAKLLGTENSSQVSTATVLEPFGFSESVQASQIDKAGPGCSTNVENVEACPTLNSSDIRLVDDAAPEASKSNEEISMERNADLALHEVGDEVLPSSQNIVPLESLNVSMVESSNVFQQDHEVIVTSGIQLTENPSTKVDPLEKNQASVSPSCPSKCIADSGNKDGDASANSLEENVYPPPSIISCAKTPISESEGQTRTIELSIEPEETDCAGEMVQSVSLDTTSNNGETSIFEVDLSTGLTEGETIKDFQSYPVQVCKESMDVKEYPSEGNPGPPSVVSCVRIPPSETGQKSRGEDASDSTGQHSQDTADAGGKVQSAALHIEHNNSNEGRNNSIVVSSSTGLSESRIIKGSPSYPSTPVNKISTDVEGYPLAADCSRIDLTTVPKHSLGNSEEPGPMSGKKRAGAKGTSERKKRQDSVKTSARANAKKRGMQETPLKQFKGDDSMMILSSPGTSNAELSGIKACGVLPTPMSNIPDLNTSVTHAYLQQPFTDPQQMQLRAQILVHGSLMQNSVPDEGCMIAAFGPSDGGGGCLWEPAWRACSGRMNTQKSDASNLETPVRSFSDSKGSDQPLGKSKSSRQGKSPLPADRASSKGIPSPIVNPIVSLSSPLWDVSTPSCVGLQSSGTYVEYHQPFSPLQPYQAQGTRGFVEQSPSWLSQTNFPGQWVATPQTSALDVNACESSMFCTEPVKLTPSKVSFVPNHPAMKQTQFSVSTGVGAGVSSGTPSQTDVNKVSILPGQNSVDPKNKKRKKVSVSKSPGQIPSLTLDQAASIHDTTNHPCVTATASQAIFQHSLLAQSMPDMRSPAVNNAPSTPNAATATFLGSTDHSSNNLPAVSPLILSEQPMRVDQIVDKNGILSEETSNAVDAARLQAEAAATHAAAAVGNCNDVWSQLSKLKNSGLRFDDEKKLSSAAMAIAAAASVAKAAAAAAELASNVAIETKLMVDEGSTTNVTRKNIHSTGISLNHSSNSSLLDAMVKAHELAAEAVSQAGKIVSIGDPLPLSELVGSSPMDYWRTPLVSSEQGMKACIDSEKLVPSEPPKDGAIIMGEAVCPGTVESTVKNSSTSQRGHQVSDPALYSYGGTISETVKSRDAHRTAPQTSLENGMVEGCFVEVFKEGGKLKAAWFSAKILNLNDGKAFVCYTELQADDGSGKLKEWVPLKGDDFKAPTIRIPHPTTSMCFDKSGKRRRAAIMDYTWCVGDRVDVWMQDCWLEGVVEGKNNNDETTLTISIPALGRTSAFKTWHLRPTVTWQDGKWMEWPSAIQQSPTQGDTPQEKRAKLGHPAVEAAKEDKILRGTNLVESKEHKESRQLPLLANEQEFNIGDNTGNIKLDAPRIARTGLQKEGSRVVFGVPKPGKKRKFMDVSKHLDSDQCHKNTETSDSGKSARYLPQGRGGGRGWNNNLKVDIKEKQVAEDKPKVFRSGKPQSVSGRVLPQKTNPLVSAKSTGKTVSKEESNPVLRDLMEFGSVSDSPSEGPTSSKGLPRVSRKKVPSSSTRTVQLNKGNSAAGGEFDKKVEQDKSFLHVAEPRRSSRKIQPTSRLLEGLQSSLIGTKMPSVPHEKVQRNLNRGDSSSHG